MVANLVWIDLEMTGLDPEADAIIEMATIITDSDLNVMAEGPVLAIWQPEVLLAGMDEWNQTHHSASGLVDRVRQSEVRTVEAEAQTLAFVEKYVERGTAPLCGNTIWQDRRFVERYMPGLARYLHYRMIDVSSLKALAQRWYGDSAVFNKPREGAHDALVDIQNSIAELKHYRDTLFRPAG